MPADPSVRRALEGLQFGHPSKLTTRQCTELVNALVDLRAERDELKAAVERVRALPATFKSVGAVPSDLTPEAQEAWTDAAAALKGVLDAYYPGRTDETERAFEGDTMPNVDSEQIIGHLIDRHRANHPNVDHISPPTHNPHNRSDEETLRWRAYNLGRLHAWLEALNAIRTAQAGKDIGP